MTKRIYIAEVFKKKAVVCFANLPKLAEFPFKEGIASVFIPLLLFPSSMKRKVLKSFQIVLRVLENACTVSLSSFLLQKSCVCERQARVSAYRRYKPSELMESYLVHFWSLLSRN